MGELLDYWDRVKRYYQYSFKEVKGLVIAIIILGFIISFRDWGEGEVFDAGIGGINLVNALLVVTLSLLVHDAGHRLWALSIGYKSEYKVTYIGLMIGLVAAFASNGNLWVLIPSGFVVRHLSTHRIGWFRYGLNYFGQAMIAFGGTLATVTLLIILKTIGGIAPTPLIEKAILFNIVFVVTSLIPIPPLDGSKIFFGSRMLYAFVFSIVVAFTALLLSSLSLLIVIGLSVTIGIVLWIAYYLLFEQNLWKGPT